MFMYHAHSVEHSSSSQILNIMSRYRSNFGKIQDVLHETKHLYSVYVLKTDLSVYSPIQTQPQPFKSEGQQES